MGKRSSLSKKTPKELRKIKRKLRRTWRKGYKHLEKKVKEMLDAEESLGKIGRLEERVKYWLGKAKASECPAYIHTGKAQARCGVRGEYSSSMDWLFREYCFECKLTKKEALKKATFNGVFGNYR